MLICNCGWYGVNLQPRVEDDTALCPACNIAFQGITAARAVCCAAEEEAQVVLESEIVKVTGEALGG